MHTCRRCRYCIFWPERQAAFRPITVACLQQSLTKGVHEHRNAPGPPPSAAVAPVRLLARLCAAALRRSSAAAHCQSMADLRSESGTRLAQGSKPQAALPARPEHAWMPTSTASPRPAPGTHMSRLCCHTGRNRGRGALAPVQSSQTRLLAHNTHKHSHIHTYYQRLRRLLRRPTTAAAGHAPRPFPPASWGCACCLWRPRWLLGARRAGPPTHHGAAAS